VLHKIEEDLDYQNRASSARRSHGWPVLFAFLAPPPAVTAQYPGKPIRIVISSSPAGRRTSSAARSARVQEFLHQPAVVENWPGANARIAAEFSPSDADGYTILRAHRRVLVNRPVRDLRYQPLRTAPVTLAVTRQR
jgi:tripartite-type tricarboxylate transporter receptor subunit TctC